MQAPQRTRLSSCAKFETRDDGHAGELSEPAGGSPTGAQVALQRPGFGSPPGLNRASPREARRPDYQSGAPSLRGSWVRRTIPVPFRRILKRETKVFRAGAAAMEKTNHLPSGDQEGSPAFLSTRRSPVPFALTTQMSDRMGDPLPRQQAPCIRNDRTRPTSSQVTRRDSDRRNYRQAT
jgi:hypothetical protein